MSGKGGVEKSLVAALPEAVAEWIETITPECQPPKMPAQAPQATHV